jgi:hypothetical protein
MNKSSILSRLMIKGPEWYFLMLLVMAGYTPPLGFNPLLVIPMLILIAQIIYRNRVSGMVLTTVIFFCNFLFLGAILSEFQEFIFFSEAAKQLVVVGLGIWIFNLLMVSRMFYNYFQNRHVEVRLNKETQPI